LFHIRHPFIDYFLCRGSKTIHLLYFAYLRIAEWFEYLLPKLHLLSVSFPKKINHHCFCDGYFAAHPYAGKGKEGSYTKELENGNKPDRVSSPVTNKYIH